MKENHLQVDLQLKYTSNDCRIIWSNVLPIGPGGPELPKGPSGPVRPSLEYLKYFIRNAVSTI